MGLTRPCADDEGLCGPESRSSSIVLHCHTERWQAALLQLPEFYHTALGVNGKVEDRRQVTLVGLPFTTHSQVSNIVLTGDH